MKTAKRDITDVQKYNQAYMQLEDAELDFV